MKTKFILFVSLISITFLACEQDIITTTTNLSSDISQERSTLDNSVELELKSQWTSYFLAKIFSDENNGIQVSNYLVAKNTNVIKLSELFGANQSPLNFKPDFLFYLENEMKGVFTEPDWEKDKPGDLTIPPGNAPVNIEEHVASFMAYLIDENCLEIYFPNGFNLQNLLDDNTTSGIISSAHPLDNSNINDGIKRFLTLQPIEEFPFYYITDSVSVDSTTTDIIIVTRPYRSETFNSKKSCNYREYSNIDFTDFLD